MAFEKGNESTPNKLYTGLADVKVVAVNPTKEEAEKLGISMKADPVYTSVDDTTGNRKVRIDIYVTSDKTSKIDKMAFFLEDAPRVSEKGNTQFINDFGDASFSESIEAIASNPKMSWFKSDGIRPAFGGEADLIDFIKALLNIQKGSVAKLDNPKALFTGNVSEIAAIFKANPERKVQVLYTVRENDGNWYQGVYTKYFGRAGNTKTTYWQKHMDNLTTVVNYQNSFAFQEFNPLEVTVEKSTSDAPEQKFW